MYENNCWMIFITKSKVYSNSKILVSCATRIAVTSDCCISYNFVSSVVDEGTVQSIKLQIPMNFLCLITTSCLMTVDYKFLSIYTLCLWFGSIFQEVK